MFAVTFDRLQMVVLLLYISLTNRIVFCRISILDSEACACDSESAYRINREGLVRVHQWQTWRVTVYHMAHLQNEKQALLTHAKSDRHRKW